MKKYLNSIGMLIYFCISQIIGTIILLVWKIYTDSQWVDKLLNATENQDFTVYLSCMSEILFYTLIIADIIILVPILINCFKKKEKVINKISFNENINIIVFATICNIIVSGIVNMLPNTTSELYNSMMSIITNGSFGLVLLTSGILAPIVEEFIFRYFMINQFKDKGINKAIIISSIAFGIMHLNIIQSTYAFILGLILGYLYIKNNEFNLYRCILFHITVNAGSVVYEYTPNKILPYINLFLLISISTYLLVRIKKIIKNEIICLP